MTLIITELSEYGIAMVADSAMRYAGRPPYVKNDCEKLQQIPYLKAGISMWGLGGIRGTRTDLWIKKFIINHAHIKSLDEFANELANTLQQAVGSTKIESGFHLAGYIEKDGVKLPTLYHIRNVEGNFLHYDFHNFIAGHDFPPQEITTAPYPKLRNGDYGPYAWISDAIEIRLDEIMEFMLPAIDASLAGKKIPSPTLEGRLRYLDAHVSFISGLYASSELLPSIGGNILSLGITPIGSYLRPLR